jgi:hypothetical protein
VTNLDGEEVWINKAASAVKVLDEEWWGCPRQSLREQPQEWSRILFYYDLFQKGHLPDDGAVSRQSNAMIETLRILHNENTDCDKIISEKEARKNRGRPAGQAPPRRR